jgi:hypothetical protein
MLKKAHTGISKRHVERGLHPVVSAFNGTLHHTFEGTSGESHPTLGKHYRVRAEEAHHEAIVQELRRHEHVETAYILPPAIIPDMSRELVEKMIKRSKAKRAAGTTPDLSDGQNAMFDVASKGGMDIQYAHSLGGGWYVQEHGNEREKFLSTSPS